MNIFRRTHNEIVESDKDRKIRIELGESYSNMVGMAAWKDLLDQMDRMVAQSVVDEDAIPINVFDVAISAEGRGIRKAIQKIKKHVSDYTQGG